MTRQPKDFLSETERQLKERFTTAAPTKQELRRGGTNKPLPSNAIYAPKPNRVDAIVLPDNQRAKMPMTKDKYLVKENPVLVFWEREIRKFLRNLSPECGHRVSAVMIFEWATGLSVAELDKAGKEAKANGDRTHQQWRADLRHMNRILEYYFGKPYMTYIAGRKVPRAYVVKPGYYIKRHRPKSLELYAEYCEGTLVA